MRRYEGTGVRRYEGAGVRRCGGARAVGLLLLLLALSLASGVAAQEPSWRDSLEVLNRQIRLNPSSTDLRLKKAAVNIELGQWEYAIDEYSRVLEIEPGHLSALYFRAYAYNCLRRYELARYDYEAFLATMPRHFEAQLGLAMVKRNMGKHTEAMDDLNQLVQMFPDSALAFAARAGFEAEQRQYELALFDWDEAIRLAPASIDFYISKADALLALKRKKDARKVLRQAVDKGASRAALRDWFERCK